MINLKTHKTRWIVGVSAAAALTIAGLSSWTTVETMPTAHAQTSGAASAIFAGGCFWCVEKDFDHVPGVIATTSGYAGGHTDNPTYKQVSYTDTGHYEVVKVDYDPAVVSYDQLLTAFWHSVDPTDDGGQFCDRGHSYKTAIIALDAQQSAAAEASKQALIAGGKNIVTPVLAAARFYPAETYHQDYYKKNPVRYNYYRRACGRNNRVKQVWGADAYKGISKETS